MELSLWYSHNHKCYKTRIGYIPWDANIGYVNGFSEELMAIIPLTYKKRTSKEKLIVLLKNTINLLEKN